MKIIVHAFVVVLMFVSVSSAQSEVATRAVLTKDGLVEGYVGFSHTFKNGVYTEVSYYGAPGSHEVWSGVGYSKDVEEFNFTNAVYLVAGNNKQLGVGLGSYGEGQVKKKVNLDYEVYAFLPTRGETPRYMAVDHVDLTRTFAKHFEAGGSIGLYFEKGAPVYKVAGGVFKINDKLGSTTFRLRGGTDTEFVISRSFTF